VRTHLEALFLEHGAVLSGFYYCPHHPEGSVPEFTRECDCRKPAEGLLRQAAADLDVDFEDAWLVGDILDDIEAGNRAGCRTILVDRGHETEWRQSEFRQPHFVVRALDEAARIIVDARRAASTSIEGRPVEEGARS
jgi:histidinol phosphatase-like enzyme